MMLKKFLWTYFILTALLGFVSGGGLLGAVSMMLLAPGGIADAVLTPRGQHNQGLMFGVSLVFWLGVWAWSRINAPAKPEAPREVSLIRQKTYEIEEPSSFFRPGGYE